MHRSRRHGTKLADSYRQATVYVGKVLGTVKPTDLPVMQPTRIGLVINLNTAKALGLDVSMQLQRRADEIIE